MQEYGEIEGNLKHIIVGAGSFSHAHIRVLNELNVKRLTLVKKTEWTTEKIQHFVEKYPNLDLTFNNKPNFDNEIVHIVTPSNTHTLIMNQCKNSKKIFVEKPSVLYNSVDDFESSNNIFSLVYQNDWLAQIQNYRQNKLQPKKINFVYHVKNKDKIDHITEIWSHVINFISLWFEPTCKIHIQKIYQTETKSFCKIVINDYTTLSIKSSNGFVENSQWSLSIDNENFTNNQLGGQLLKDTLNTMLYNQTPLTDWYKSSWLIHKFRLLTFSEMFDNHYCNYYRYKNV